ncbi:conserved Plasmodium protein, unknown function [Plasmodium vinckei vinckei]|uniref:Chorein N-terminal domain-containing protein n=1 Tax=Plasmodium vinckei vinckei TaxID=54757 RepID=A0A449BP40_PLAVN|nr:conserved Plasmodium protein, unknown function [Plasmodium vinckei vinckei]VEV55179.1 conserved Plasmodium protein, unknown function [Plasmodium vinckei vinckei]
MIKGLSKNIVNFLLSSFFENIEEKQLQTSLIRGKVHLQNVKIKKKFFDILYLPYTIKYGYIRSLDLQIPLLYLFQKATITIKDVVIVIKEKNFNDFNIVEEINGVKIAKKNNLKIEETNSSGPNLNQKINKGINSLLYELYNNISIDIENVEVILEGSEKKKNILGLFIKRITSYKSHNQSFKIYKDFSFIDGMFYMEDEKAKYLINKIIKKEEKRKKNKKKNRNGDEIYNKIKDVTNNLHKKKYIISEVPIVVLSTILSVEKSTQYMHYNSKYIFKKKKYFDLKCSHCDKYLYQCKEVKKEKGIFEKFLNQNIHFNDDDNKLSKEECEVCRKKNDLEKLKHEESAKDAVESNAHNNASTIKDDNQINSHKQNNHICENCKQNLISDKKLYNSESNLQSNVKENKLSNIDNFNILEENINFKENEYITFILHVDNFNVNLSFTQLCQILDIVNFYLIYSCFVNGLYLEEWLNIPEVKEILMYKKELLKKRKKEKHDKDFIENFEYTHSFQIIYSIRKHVNNILRESKTSDNSINNKVTATPKNDTNNNMKNDTSSLKNSTSNLDASNELDSNDKVKKNEKEQEKNSVVQNDQNYENLHSVRNMQSKSSEEMPVILNFKLVFKKVNLNLYSYEKTNKIIQINMINFELALKNYINTDFAYFILLNDINVLFLYKNKKYPLLSLFKTNTIENVNQKGKKKDSFNKKNRRKSINYLFNPDVCNSISQGVINRNDTTTIVNTSSNETGLDKDGGGSTSIIDSKSEKSIHNIKGKQDKNKEVDKNKLNDHKINNKSKDDKKVNPNEIKNTNKENENAISLFVYNKFDTSQNKIYFRCNRNLLITLSVKEIYNVMNINYDFKCLDFEKKIKTYQSLYYYYLLGKKYCRELYISSEKDFADININFMNNIYINLIINKKYSLLARLQKISLNSFFFTKTNIQSYLENLTMINDNKVENQESLSKLDATNSVNVGFTPNNNILLNSNDSIINGSNSELNQINNRNELINNNNDDKKDVIKGIIENESKIMSNKSYSNIYYNDSKKENVSISNSYYNKMLSSDNDICDDNQKIKMEYKKYYQDFLRVNDLKNIEKSKKIEKKYNKNQTKQTETNNIDSSNELSNTIVTSNIVEKNKYDYLSSSSYKSKIYNINYNDSNYIHNSNSSYIQGEAFDFDSEVINEHKEKRKNKYKKKKRKVETNSESEHTNSYNHQKKKKKSVSNKDVNSNTSDDNTSVTCSEKEEKETLITAVQQKRTCFNLSIFFMKNKSNEKIQKILLEENSKNKKYVLKPLKISFDAIIYNFKDGNEKRLSFIHTNYKQYLYLNFDDKHIFKLIFFYYHYKFYVDKIFEQLNNRNNSDYLNLNTIDFRSYKTLQVLLDNAFVNNKSEIENKFVHKKSSDNELVSENEGNKTAEVIESSLVDNEIETHDYPKVCENQNEEEANTIINLNNSTVENCDHIQEDLNNNISLNDTNVENDEIIDIEKFDENNTTICVNTENDVSVKKESINIQKVQKNVKKKEKKKNFFNYEKAYNKVDRNVNNEISNSNKHELITFLSKIKIYFNNYKKNKRMISIHIYDVLIYLFNDDQISKLVLNLKKFNVLNCLSYQDHSHINRHDASTCENNYDIQDEHNFNSNRYFNNDKYYNLNTIPGFENKHQINKINKIDSKLYDKKNSTHNGIYLYNSILKLAKNGDFIFSYDYKNPQIDKINKNNKSLSNIDTQNVKDKNVTSNNETQIEESTKKINGYQELYNNTSMIISEDPKKIHFDNVNKRFTKKSIDFVHPNYYNSLNVDYFTFNAPETNEQKPDDTLEICPSSIDAGISSIEIANIPVDTTTTSIELPNISTDINNSIIEKPSQSMENEKTSLESLTNVSENINTNNNPIDESYPPKDTENANLIEQSNEVSNTMEENDKFMSVNNTQSLNEIDGEIPGEPNEQSDKVPSPETVKETLNENMNENMNVNMNDNANESVKDSLKGKLSKSDEEDGLTRWDKDESQKKRRLDLDISIFRALKKAKCLDIDKDDINEYYSFEIMENDRIEEVEKGGDIVVEGAESGAEDNGANLETGVISADESVSQHGYSNEVEVKNTEGLKNKYEDEYDEEGNDNENEDEEVEIVKRKEIDDIQNIAFHLVNFEVIIDYIYFINVYKWITKLNLKYEQIKKISDFSAYSYNSINEKSDANTPKFNYTLFLQNNKIYIPIYKLSIHEYTYYENAKNNLYTSFLPTMEFHFSCSYKSINENEENLTNVQVRNFGNKLVVPSLQMYKHKKSRRWKICILNFNCKDKTSETILNDFRFQLNMRRKQNNESLDIDEEISSYEDLNMPDNRQKINSLNTYFSAMSSNILDGEKNSNIKSSIKKIIRFYNDPIIINFSSEIIKNMIICYNNFNYFMNYINRIQTNINNSSNNEKYEQNNSTNLDAASENKNIINDILNYLYNETNDILFEYFLDDFRLSLYEGHSNLNMPLINISMFDIKVFFQKKYNINNFINFYLNIDVYDNYKILYDNLIEKVEILLSFENCKNKMNILNFNIETSYINILYTNKIKDLIINYSTMLLDKYKTSIEATYEDIDADIRRKEQQMNSKLLNFFNNIFIIKNQNNPKYGIGFKDTLYDNSINITSKIYNFTGLTINLRFKQSLRSKVQNHNEKKDGHDNVKHNGNKNKFIFYELPNNGHGGLLKDENGKVCELAVIIKLFNYIYEIVDIERNKNTCDIRFIPIIYDLKKSNEKKKIIIKKYDNNYDMYNEYSVKNKVFKTFIKLYIQTNIDDKGVVTIYFSSNLFIHNTTNTNFVILYHPIIYYFLLFNELFIYNQNNLNTKKHSLKGTRTVLKSNEKYFFPIISFMPLLVIYDYMKKKNNEFIEKSDEHFINTNIIKSKPSKKISDTYSDIHTFSKHNRSYYIDYEHALYKKNEIDNDDYTNSFIRIDNLKKNSLEDNETYNSVSILDKFTGNNMHNTIPINTNYNLLNSPIYQDSNQNRQQIDENKINLQHIKESNKCKLNKILKKLKIYINEKNMNNSIKDINNIYIVKKDVYNYYINKYYSSRKCYLDIFNFLKKNGARKLFSNSSVREIIYRHSYDFQKYNLFSQTLKLKTIKVICCDPNSKYGNGKYKNEDGLFNYKQNNVLNNFITNREQLVIVSDDNRDDTINANKQIDVYDEKHSAELKQIPDSNYLMKFMTLYEKHEKKNKNHLNSAKNNILMSIDSMKTNERYLGTIHRNRKGSNLSRRIKYYYENSLKNEEDNLEMDEHNNVNKNTATVDNSHSDHVINMEVNENSCIDIQNNCLTEEKKEKNIPNANDALCSVDNDIKNENLKRIVFSAKKQSNFSNTLICEQKNLEINKFYTFGILIDYIFEVHNLMFNDISIGYYQKYNVNNIPKKIKKIKKETILPKSVKHLDNIPSYIKFFYQINGNSNNNNNVEDNEITYTFHFFSKKIPIHQLNNTNSKYVQIKMRIGCIHDTKNDIIYKKKQFRFNLFRRKATISNTIAAYSSSSSKKRVYLSSANYEKLCQEIPRFFYLNIVLRRKTDFSCTNNVNSFKKIIDSSVLQLLLYSYFYFQNNLDNDIIIQSNANSQKVKKNTCMLFGELESTKVVLKILHNNKLFTSKKLKINEVCLNKKIILTCKQNKKREYLFLSLNITIYGNIYNTKIITINNRYTIINNTNHTLYVQEICKEFKIIKKDSKTLPQIEKTNQQIVSEKEVKQNKMNTNIDEEPKSSLKNKIFNVFEIKPHESFYYHPLHANKYYLKFSYTNINDYINNNILPQSESYEFMDKYQDAKHLVYNYLKKKIPKKTKNPTYLINIDKNDQTFKKKEELFNQFYTSPIDIEKVGSSKIFHKALIKVPRLSEHVEKDEAPNMAVNTPNMVLEQKNQFDMYNKTKLVDEIKYSENIKTQNETILLLEDENEPADIALSIKNSIESVKNFVINMNEECNDNSNESAMKYCENDEVCKNKNTNKSIVKQKTNYWYKEENIISEVNITLNSNTSIEINISIDNNPDTIIHNNTNYCLVYYQRKTKKKIVNLLKPYDKEIFGWTDISKPKVVKFFLVLKKVGVYVFYCNVDIVKEHNCIVINDNRKINVSTKIENGKRVFCLEEINTEALENQLDYFVNSKSFIKLNEEKKVDTTNKKKKKKKIVKIDFYRKFRLKKNRDDDIRAKQQFLRYRKSKKKKKNFLKEFKIINKNPFNAIYMKAKKKKQKQKQTERKMKNTKKYFNIRSLFILKNLDLKNKKDNNKFEKRKKKNTKIISNKMSNKQIIEYDTNQNNSSNQTKKFDEQNFKALFMKKTIRGKKKKKKNINKLLYDSYKRKFSHQTSEKFIYSNSLEGSIHNNVDNDKVSEHEQDNYYALNNNMKVKRKLSDYIFRKIKNNEKKLKGLKKIYPAFLRNSKSIEFNEIMEKCFSDKGEEHENIDDIKSLNNNLTHSRMGNNQGSGNSGHNGKASKKNPNYQIKFFTNIQLWFKGIKLNLLEESSNYLISFEVNNLFVKKEYIENIGYYNVDIKIKNILSYAIYKYLSVYALLYTNDEINLKKNNMRIFINKLESKRNLFLKKKKYIKDEDQYSIISSVGSTLDLKDRGFAFPDYRLDKIYDSTDDFNDNSEFIVCNFQYVEKFETLFFKYFLLSIKPLVINADINSITVLFYFYKTFYTDQNFENEEGNTKKLHETNAADPTMYTYTLNDDQKEFSIENKKNNEIRDNYYSSNLLNEHAGGKTDIDNRCLACGEVNNCLILDQDNAEFNNDIEQNQLVKDKVYRNIDKYIKEDENVKNNIVTSHNCEKGEASKHVYLQYVCIDKINILLNFKSEYKKELNNNNINDAFYEEYISAYNKLGDISNCNIILKSLSNIHIFTNANNLFNFLLNFYYNQTIVNLSNLLISFNIIGSPTSFIAHVKKSFCEFFAILKDNEIEDKEYEIEQNKKKNISPRNNLSYRMHGELDNISFVDHNNPNNLGDAHLFSKIQNKEDIFNFFDGSNESSLIDEKEDIMGNEKYIMHLLNDYNSSCENNTIYEDKHLNSIKNTISFEFENKNDINRMSYSDYTDNGSIEPTLNLDKKNELENLMLQDDSISLSYLNFDNKRNDILDDNQNELPNDHVEKKENEKKQNKKKQNIFMTSISFITGCWNKFMYLIRKLRRLFLGMYVLNIELILSLLFSVTLILQSLINIIDKININSSNRIVLRNKKYERNKPLVSNNIEEFHNFNITKLFYYYISLYINMFSIIYYNILYKIKKNKTDITRENNIIKTNLKLNTPKKRKFAFIFNFFLIIFTIIKIFILGHIVFSLLCLLTINNTFQTILRSCIKLVYYQTNKNCLDFLNTNNINHISTISYIKINQVLNKYISLKEPFKIFLTYQDFVDIKTQNKINYFVYTKELFFYIQENNVLFLFRKNDLKKIDVIIHTVTNSFTINRFYNRKESRFFRKNLSRNIPDLADHVTCDENNSVESSFYNKSLGSNDPKENKNIIYFFNSELALTKKNEIINLNNNNQNYMITINITVRNNMNIMENVYYNPNKFFKFLSKIEKNYNNIYSPLFKSSTNDGKHNKEKYNKNKTNIETRCTGSKGFGFFSFFMFLLKCTILFYPIYLLFQRNKTIQDETPERKSKKNKEENKGINDDIKKGKGKNVKKNVPKHIVFKLNFEDFQSCLNIFECLCRFVNND